MRHHHNQFYNSDESNGEPGEPSGLGDQIVCVPNPALFELKYVHTGTARRADLFFQTGFFEQRNKAGVSMHVVPGLIPQQRFDQPELICCIGLLK